MKYIVWLIDKQIKVFEPDGRVYRSTSSSNYSKELKEGINYLSKEDFESIVWKN